jgi:hypothetical protein
MTPMLTPEAQLGGLAVIERIRAVLRPLDLETVSRGGMMYMLEGLRQDPTLFDPHTVALHDAFVATTELDAQPRQGVLIS